MEVRIDRGIFLHEIQKMQNITPIKGTKPILSYLLLAAYEGGIDLFATDLDVGIKTHIAAEVAVPGTICIPAKVVYDIVKELPDGTSLILILGENNRLRLTCLHSVFHIPCISAEGFPAFPVLDTSQMHPIPFAVLAQMFSTVNIAVPLVEQKLYNAPAGALFSVDHTGIEMAGTDGHRMTYMYTELTGLPYQARVILPKKLLEEITRFLPDKERDRDKEKGHGRELQTSISGNHIVLCWDDVLVFARLLEKKFPDYKDAVGAKNDKILIIDKERLRLAVRRVSMISENKEWFIRLKLTDEKLYLDSESAESGDAHDEIEVEYKGEPLEIGFNPRYILDFLSVINSPEVVLEMTDNESMAIMRPRDSENIKCIIMPVRL